MNIYDEYLEKLERAERNVQIAEKRLFKSKRVLNEVLNFIEKRILLNELVGPKGMYGIEVIVVDSKDKRDVYWQGLDINGNTDLSEEPLIFKSEKEARSSKEFRNALKKYGKDKVRVRPF